MEKLDSEMNRFHSQKVAQATDELEKGLMNQTQTNNFGNKIYVIY